MATVGYGAAGNLTADGTHTYTWDGEGRLLSVDGTAGCGGSFTVCYAYNVFGQRGQKVQSGSPWVYTNSTHDASGRLIYYDNGTSQTQIFQWLGSKMIGYYTTWNRYTHTNALGSVTALTDVNGYLYQEEQFFPWGQQWTGSIQDERFAGMQARDGNTGLDNTPNRHPGNHSLSFCSPRINLLSWKLCSDTIARNWSTSLLKYYS